MRKSVCKACGGEFRTAESDTVVCSSCFRTFHISECGIRPKKEKSRLNSGKRLHNGARAGICMFCAFFAIVFIPFCQPLTFLMVLTIIWNCMYIKARPEEELSPEELHGRNLSGKDLLTYYDYVCVLRTLPLHDMPLGEYGMHLEMQIKRLHAKQKALYEMLEKKHPFIQTARDAERFILENFKDVFWRLKYGNQKNPAECKRLGDVMQAKIEENNRILQQYENLVIAVTEMDDGDLPHAEPYLDVLAETLRSIREDDLQQMMT